MPQCHLLQIIEKNRQIHPEIIETFNLVTISLLAKYAEGLYIQSITPRLTRVQIFFEFRPTGWGQSAVVARCDTFRVTSSLNFLKKICDIRWGFIFIQRVFRHPLKNYETSIHRPPIEVSVFC